MPTTTCRRPTMTKRSFHELKRSQQAGILCNDPQFCEWLDFDQESAPAFVRAHCGVASRRELDDDETAAARWDRLLGRYRRETGQEPEVRG